MKRYILINRMPKGGGAEKQAYLLFTNMPADKIVCLEQGDEYGIPASGIVHLSDHVPATSALIKYLSLPLYAYRLYKLIKKEGNVQVISFMERSNYTNILLKIFKKHEAVISVRVHPGFFTGIKKINRLLNILLLHFSDKITSNSADTINWFEKRAGKKNRQKLFLTPNGYDLADIRLKATEPLPTAVAPVFNSPVLISMGRLCEQKGQLFLINSFIKLRPSVPALKLVLLGAGPLLEPLIAHCKANGLTAVAVDSAAESTPDADVYFLGLKQNPFKYIARSSLFALSSVNEGLPGALIEAMICLVPVIAANCPSGPREIICPHMSEDTPVNSPVVTNTGVLMPTFVQKDFTDEAGRTAKEHIWASEITRLFTTNNLLAQVKSGNAERVMEYDEENVLASWNRVLHFNKALQ
jgi:glycosyltransferase involved in cell wall biosynthesis